MGLGEGQPQAQRERPLTNLLCSGCRWQMWGACGAEDLAFPWPRRYNSPCPPSEGCQRPGPSGRRAVTLPVRWSGGGLREGSAPLSGPKAGSLDFMGERSAYQRLTGAEEESQVKGQPDSLDPEVCW